MALSYYASINLFANQMAKFYNSADTHFVSLKAPSGQASDVNFILPGADTADGAMLSDGSGNLTLGAIANVNVASSAAIAASKLAVLVASNTTINVSSNVTLTNRSVHFVDTSAARSLTLPAPNVGMFMVVKDSTGSCLTNNITLVRNGSEKIETVAASYVLNYSLGSWTIISDGTDWFLI